MLPRVVKGNEDSSIYSALPLVKTNDPYIRKLVFIHLQTEQIHVRATHFLIGRDRDLCFKVLLIKLNLLPLNYWLEYLDLVFFINF